MLSWQIRSSLIAGESEKISNLFGGRPYISWLPSFLIYHTLKHIDPVLAVILNNDKS